MSHGEERVVCGEAALDVPLRWESGTPFRVIVAVTCVLSMCGAVFIIVSYAFYRSLRNRARLILVHVSLMDFGTALSKFVGTTINFDRDYVVYNASCTIYHAPQRDYIEGLCAGQAFFLHFSTIGSVLWITSLSVYLYFLLMHHQTSYARLSLYASYFLCYGFSLFVSVWLLLSGGLGYGGNSYCGIVAVNMLTGRVNKYATVFGYDFWVYITMTFIPVLYLAVHLYLRDMLKQSKHYLRDGEERFKEALLILDYRFFLIPLVFALLHMWTCMRFLFEIYLQLNGVPLPIKILVFYLSGIGDSAQGLTNGFLYVLFTKKVRRTVFSSVSCNKKEGDEGESTPILGGGSVMAKNSVNGAPSCMRVEDRLHREMRTSDIFTPIIVSVRV